MCGTRRPWRRNPVDGLLVFGVPLGGFALQAALVHEFHHGVAWSAVAIAAIYAVLFLGVRKRAEPGFPLLSRAFLALSVIFATIAIPFAFDDRYTAAIWAVEAAGVYWIGVRQDARFARAFALLVEAGAGIAFVLAGVPDTVDTPFANAHFAGAMLIAVSGLVTAYLGDRATERAERGRTPLGAGGIRLGRALVARRRGDRARAAIAAAGGTSCDARLGDGGRCGGAGCSRRGCRGLASPAPASSCCRRWPSPRTSISSTPEPRSRSTAGSCGRARGSCIGARSGRPSRCASPHSAPQYSVLGASTPSRRQHRAVGTRYAAIDVGKWLDAAHALSALALTVQIAWEASEWIGRWTARSTAWTPCAAALPAIAFLWLVVRYRDSAHWPFPMHRRAYAIGAGAPVAVLVVVWFFAVNLLSPGNVSPLPYVPLANALDVTLALALWASAAWAVRFAGLPERALYRWVAAGAFVALNGIVLRTAHHWGDVPWRMSAMLASKPLQAALTLTWTVTALAAMVVASRRRLRMLWMLGAALLAAVVAKLFLVDLGSLSGLPRVVAFLGVGVLLLIIGFVSPLPPAAPEEAARARCPARELAAGLCSHSKRSSTGL